eukprot:2873868-Amphidinium_carterae.2
MMLYHGRDTLPGHWHPGYLGCSGQHGINTPSASNTWAGYYYWLHSCCKQHTQAAATLASVGACDTAGVLEIDGCTLVQTVLVVGVDAAGTLVWIGLVLGAMRVLVVEVLLLVVRVVLEIDACTLVTAVLVVAVVASGTLVWLEHVPDAVERLVVEVLLLVVRVVEVLSV